MRAEPDIHLDFFHFKLLILNFDFLLLNFELTTWYNREY
jgi:hypothetical protein